MAGEQSSPHDVFLLDLSASGATNGDSGGLLKALRESRISTFIIEDEELLDPGRDEITPAIEASKIAIVVVTGGCRYVSLRRWKALTYILDHFQRNPQLIIPVYYMDRSAARANLFSLEDTSENRKKYVHELSKLMAQVENLPGWDYNGYKKNIDEFNREIASQVSKKLNGAPPLHVAAYPVGLESRLKVVWSFLKLTSSKRDFLSIGIYGMQQGIGKSVLARAVYNSVAHLFEFSCFLHNIRDNSNTHGLVGVQKMLLFEISGETDILLENVDEGVSMIKDRLYQKDVLLILDDVDSLEQLEALGRGPGWGFSSGSRVIITTRNKDLLTYHGNDVLPYDVPPLNDNDAFELLSHRAFEHGNVDTSYTEVLNQAIRYAFGLPLVLDMIGTSWYGRTVDECKHALDRLERIRRDGREGAFTYDDIQRIRVALTYNDNQSIQGFSTSIQGALTYNDIQSIQGDAYNDIQSIQGALTITQVGRVSHEHKERWKILHSVSEFSQISLSVSEVSQTLLIDPEGSQTTRVAGVMSQSLQRDFQAVMWRLVCLASSGVGLVCNALSPPFKRLIGGWNPLKFFIYVVFSLGVWAIILYSNQSRIFHRLKCYICYGIFLGISVYSYFYDRAVDGKPEILCLVSNAAFALASLSLSKLFEAGFETGMFSYFLECFTVQLITINWKLIVVAIIFGGPLFRWHFSSEPSRITRRFGTIPLRNLNN